jgi:hypothetical protein
VSEGSETGQIDRGDGYRCRRRGGAQQPVRARGPAALALQGAKFKSRRRWAAAGPAAPKYNCWRAPRPLSGVQLLMGRGAGRRAYVHAGRARPARGSAAFEPGGGMRSTEAPCGAFARRWATRGAQRNARGAAGRLQGSRCRGGSFCAVGRGGRGVTGRCGAKVLSGSRFSTPAGVMEPFSHRSPCHRMQSSAPQRPRHAPRRRGLSSPPAARGAWRAGPGGTSPALLKAAAARAGHGSRQQPKGCGAAAGGAAAGAPLGMPARAGRFPNDQI